MSLIDLDYYYPSSNQSGVKFNDTNKVKNTIESLYSTEGTTLPTSNYSDPYGYITTTYN